ncbi:MAG: hypothetical protein V7L25_33545 [Nostoc sp.]|uniref:hypothetical protein n=1 Tax=Nostoc sp. TaxID=1180 RepID=UPI002FF39F0C
MSVQTRFQSLGIQEDKLNKCDRTITLEEIYAMVALIYQARSHNLSSINGMK